MKKLIFCGALLVALAATTDAEPPAGRVLYFQSGDLVEFGALGEEAQAVSYTHLKLPTNREV